MDRRMPSALAHQQDAEMNRGNNDGGYYKPRRISFYLQQRSEQLGRELSLV